MIKASLRTGISIFVAAAAAISMLHAQAGKAVTSHDGSCQVTVPDDWQQAGSFGIASSPDKSVHLAVSSPKMSPTLVEVEQTAPSIYPNDKIVKQTPTEFQMEGLGGDGKPNVYRGIQIPGKVCLVEVNYASGTIDDARKIAGSLKAAH